MDIKNTQEDHKVPATKNPQSLAIPITIIIGFAMISIAIFFGLNMSADSDKNEPATGDNQDNAININPITEKDHIKGNPNAPIMIVEYSDFDCPFCKSFHETMNQVMENYGPTGQVAWVYRHMPLESIHPSAPHIAAASECVAKLAGNEAFWTFADLAFDERGINDPVNLARLDEFATAAGADVNDFNACLDDKSTRADVEEDFTDAVNAGAEGTPYSIITVGGQTGVINGAQPYKVVSQIIDNLIAQINNEG